ncbi:ARM repeat superfamily protein [Prunus dulcis]|uniref:Exportin-T n=1 Tax=Prunus dulcis TaxID=3755 RepID=A0A4Y1R3X3_PRUDU|nr:ARM repeat superfamily protein [Prunus dulcis]
MRGAMVIDMFCRVLNALDEELINLDYPRTPEELAVAARVKDAMRQQCVAQIVRAWYDIVSMYRNSDEELCASVLESMRRYISWIDIGLIVNDAFIPLLFELVLVGGLSEQLRGAAAGCLSAVVSKRMDPQSKLPLLQSLQMRRVFGLVAQDSDSELVSNVAALLTGYAVEVLECFKRLNSEDAKGYVATMKTLSPLRETQLLHVGQILEVIRSQIRYDPMYRKNLGILDKIGREEEDRMVEFRKDLFVLLRNVGRVAPDVTQIFIRNSLATAVGSSSNWNVEEVEAALSLFYAFGESINGEAMRTGSGLLVTRYMKFVQENTQYIHMVLAAFLDERGIHHPNVNVSRRASYLFMRVVKLLKLKLVPFIENILQSLQDTVAGFTSMDYTSKELSGSEDGSHIFEAIGLLIGMEDVPPAKQSDYLSSLLTPLCQQVEALLRNAKVLTPEEAPQKLANIQQIIVAINSLSKGFSERLVTASRPAIGLMFKQTLDVLLQVLVVFPNVEALRSKVTSFVHRMVDTLGASVFPYLPKALEQLLVDSEPKELVGLLILLNQLICKFNTLFRDILDEVFPAIAGRILNVIPVDALPSGPGSNTEENRELQELQRTLYTFLHVCVQIFIRLIRDWCAMPNGEEKVPGFQSFIIENFATNCCLYSLLDNSFEFRDANTLVLFGEIVLAQKVMYEKFGNDFLVHFVSKGFPAAHCPQDLAETYCQKLQGSDIKALKSFYQSLIENLRLQQNGSLVNVI